MKFRVLRGKHQILEHSDGDNNVPKSTIYQTGDVVESDVNLAKRFNRRNSRKFKKVPDDTPVSCSSGGVPDLSGSEEDDNELPEIKDAFSELTINELKAVAAEEEIDLGKAKNKSEILEVLRGQLC